MLSTQNVHFSKEGIIHVWKPAIVNCNDGPEIRVRSWCSLIRISIEECEINGETGQIIIVNSVIYSRVLITFNLSTLFSCITNVRCRFISMKIWFVFNIARLFYQLDKIKLQDQMNPKIKMASTS